MSKADPGQANLFEDTRVAAIAEGLGRGSNAFFLPAIRIMQSRAPGVVIYLSEIVDVLTAHGVAIAIAMDAVNEASLEGLHGHWLLEAPAGELSEAGWIRGGP